MSFPDKIVTEARPSSHIHVTSSQTQAGNSELERKNRQFTYSEVLNITRNFQRVLGEGAFGKVYHGYIGDAEVAVKMLSATSTQGQREFETEVCRHKVLFLSFMFFHIHVILVS